MTQVLAKPSAPGLVAGGILSIAAGVLHFAIIIGGGNWYRFFGAGEDMARMAENGSLIPTVVTSFIALILVLWGLYGFAGAGYLKNLPFTKQAILIIGSIYTIRGIGIVPQMVMYFIPGQEVFFRDIMFSAVSLTIGLCYLTGYRAVFRN